MLIRSALKHAWEEVSGGESRWRRVEDIRRDSGLFGESARAPEVQAAIGAAMKRGLQTRDWELDMGRALDNP